MSTNETPTLDRAIGDVQRLIRICKEPTTERMHAIAAMIQLENAADLLDKAARILRLHSTKEYDAKLHDVAQVSLVKDIEKLLQG